jgi:hypothetical protein
MPETRTPVQTVEVDMTCPVCEVGKMRSVGQRFLTSPPKYPHLCNNDGCDYTQVYLRCYPYIDYDPIGGSDV